ncbi:MAG: phosphoenolpyruvate mutase [Gammaproteobacteria bacterium]|jgi:phosphoenolpyruvate phosphomutase
MSLNQQKTNPSKLKALLLSDDLEFILEAHNGISARIAEEAGFSGIWASGLALSAQYGVRDNNEASWTQVVDMVEFMVDACNIPILLDGDTGYGNFNNMRRLVRKLEQRGVSGVCIEDKLFPKTNSFISGERQELADIDEFCGKIAAGKDSQTDDDFCVVARVEAYIAGWNTAEALRRAEAYRKAGADAILIHSAHSEADQIIEFAHEWAGRAPLVIVPTKYYSTPTKVFRDAKINLVIWANHLIRSSVTAMQGTARKIQLKENLVEVEDDIATVKEIFRLQGADELQAAEKQYFLGTKRELKAILLAAAQGPGLENLTADRPKVMLPVNGKPLLSRLIDQFKKHGIDNLTVVGGYKHETIPSKGIKLIVNDLHATTGELTSLLCAKKSFTDDMVVMYGDVLFRGYVLRSLIESDREITVMVDSQMLQSDVNGTPDYAYCSGPDDRSLWGQDILLQEISGQTCTENSSSDGLWIGMMRVHGEGRKWIEEALDQLSEDDKFSTFDMKELLNKLVLNKRPIRVIYIHGHWINVNSLQDLERAVEFATNHSQSGPNT